MKAIVCLLGGIPLSWWSLLAWRNAGFNLDSRKYDAAKQDGIVLFLFLLVGIGLIAYGWFELAYGGKSENENKERNGPTDKTPPNI